MAARRRKQNLPGRVRRPSLPRQPAGPHPRRRRSRERVAPPERVSRTTRRRCHGSLVTRLLATRTQVVLLVLALVAALGVLGAIGWVTWSARAAASVSADWRPACGDGRVGSHEGEPAIWSRPGWRCDVEIRVVNDSGRERPRDRRDGADGRRSTARSRPARSPPTPRRWARRPGEHRRPLGGRRDRPGARQPHRHGGDRVAPGRLQRRRLRQHQPVGDRALRGARAGAPGHGRRRRWCCARSTSDATDGCVRRSRCAGPGAPHGAWPLVAASVGTRGCHGPAHLGQCRTPVGVRQASP